jgi:hypothetical protein
MFSFYLSKNPGVGRALRVFVDLWDFMIEL